MQNSVSLLQTLFLQQGFIHLAYKIISFLDLQTLYAVINGSQSQKGQPKLFETEKSIKSLKKQSKIREMIRVHYFLKEYLNKTDRSMYYSFYEQPQFVAISKQLQQNIVIRQCTKKQSCTVFAQQFCQINHIVNTIQDKDLLPREQVQQLKRILVDPSLPLPSIKRQNQGMYCNSSFQLFLVGLRFPHFGEENFTPFEELKAKMQEEEDANFKQFLEIQKEKHSSMKTYQNLHLVRYMPYEITYNNYTELMLKDNTQHNLIVTIFAMTDVWINSIFSLINLIDDPFYKFTEIMSRYSVFRSYVMELEESLGFLFHSYETLYSDTIRDSLFLSSSMKPKYCFWRPALTKWFIKMNSIHSQTNQVYFMLLTKLREQRLLQKLDQSNDDPLWKPARKNAICIKNNLEINQLSAQMKDEIYSRMGGSSLIEEFISNNQQTCQVLIFQYVEYVVDLAVNQQTVHWCGHSKHRLEKPFDIFNNEFQDYNSLYIEHLKENVLGQVNETQKKKQLFQLLLQAEVQFLDDKNVKPVILRQIVDDINRTGIFVPSLIDFDLEKYQKTNIVAIEATNLLVQSMQNENEQDIGVNSFKEEVVFFDFAEKDQKLKYFNQKARICQSIQGEEKFFFSIPPLLSPEEILSKSINTNDTSENEQCQGDSSFQYVSDEQDCQSQQLSTREIDTKEQRSVCFEVPSKSCSRPKKVSFVQEEEQLNEGHSSQQNINQKKTLNSTNSSSNNEAIINSTHEENENESENDKTLTIEEQLQISKSQSI